ncbi:uncharacterized protein EI90DRAFT_3289475 [Cantharellus anzutake]|uniref:uncharacterized protein n=1 Tax=Cantharellus anzutake TaxID=1750568 RepID=UPI0019030A3A|nr:uncharacterized protein EI90DRAFT_3289475 [Cantharellus anzutake]KAF8331391.1 hypothetical protein EI90DRAFT_3289475 [Cantharellus anzutake]
MREKFPGNNLNSHEMACTGRRWFGTWITNNVRDLFLQASRYRDGSGRVTSHCPYVTLNDVSQVDNALCIAACTIQRARKNANHQGAHVTKSSIAFTRKGWTISSRGRMGCGLVDKKAHQAVNVNRWAISFIGAMLSVLGGSSMFTEPRRQATTKRQRLVPEKKTLDKQQRPANKVKCDKTKNM